MKKSVGLLIVSSFCASMSNAQLRKPLDRIKSNLYQAENVYKEALKTLIAEKEKLQLLKARLDELAPIVRKQLTERKVNKHTYSDLTDEEGMFQSIKEEIDGLTGTPYKQYEQGKIPALLQNLDEAKRNLEAAQRLYAQSKNKNEL